MFAVTQQVPLSICYYYDYYDNDPWILPGAVAWCPHTARSGCAGFHPPAGGNDFKTSEKQENIDHSITHSRSYTAVQAAGWPGPGSVCRKGLFGLLGRLEDLSLLTTVSC